MREGEVSDLSARFQRHVSAKRFFADGDRVLVACSGGLDSTVLLHLLRFAGDLARIELAAAHFDHRMRPESTADAEWVRGLCGAWGVPLTVGAAGRALASEADAREARYAFLLEERERLRARWVLTAHHADDQAETVLFRILRGTGLHGLGGIQGARADGVLRPLLPFWREQLLGYAEANGLAWREDASNADARFARNAVRRELLPRAELVSAGAKRSLVRLARLARRDESAWARVVPAALDALVVESGDDHLALRRDALLAHPPALRARILREAAQRLGSRLSEAGTRTGLVFTSRRASGRSVFLTGGLILARELDVIVLSRGLARGTEKEGEFVEIAAPIRGRGTLSLSGAAWEACWAPDLCAANAWTHAFPAARLAFPLRVRGWAPGDRMRLSYGSKKLKKLLVEARLGGRERRRRPVVADATGAVIWIPGLERAAKDLAEDGPPTQQLVLSIREIQAD
jgi:tRNA(Ile)-lysidine synthase